jgi:acyl-CoA dehydrogenase
VSTTERTLLADTVREVIAGFDRARNGVAAHRTCWRPALWNALEELGFTRVSVPEQLGGSGGSVADALAIARVAGALGAPVPLGESLLLGPWMLTLAGLPLPATGVITAVDAPDLELERAAGGLSVRGQIPAVPWARVATTVAMLAGGPADGEAVVLSIPVARVAVEPGCNLAGEPRDRVAVTDLTIADDCWAPAPAQLDRGAVRARGALARAAAMVGALERILEMTVRHAREREQFGRPLARFQAVAQQLAMLAAEVAAASAALDVVEERLDAGVDGLPLAAVAAAKVVAGRAATAGCAIAHQLHGAVGLTAEHPLGAFTRRLWAWRDEFGTERAWSSVLGRELAGVDARTVWARLAG